MKFVYASVHCSIISNSQILEMREMSTNRRIAATKVKFMEAQSRLKVGFQGPWGGGKAELLLNGYRISVWSDEKVLEIDNGDGSTILWMYLMPLNYTVKKRLNWPTLLHIFTIVKKIRYKRHWIVQLKWGIVEYMNLYLNKAVLKSARFWFHLCKSVENAN